MARLLAVVFALAVVLALAVVSGADAATYKRCGNSILGGGTVGAGVYNVRARGVRCQTARRIAKRYFARNCGDDPCVYGDFTCRTVRRLGPELAKARCVARRRVIRFDYGA